MPVKAPKNPKKFVFTRREPDLFGEMTPAGDATALFAPHDISIVDRLIQGIRVEGRAAGTLRIEASVLDHVSLANSSFGSIVCKDVRLVGCDLANLETRGLMLVRVEFINCRMTGFRAGEADGQDVLISEGDQRYSQFRFSRFKSAEFDSCNFEDADFQGTDLSGAIFRTCNLKNAEMSKVRLLNTDLRGSLVEGLQLNAGDIRGAVVDPAQAMIFAPLLGIRIEISSGNTSGTANRAAAARSPRRGSRGAALPRWRGDACPRR
ncbi:MAG TPA: pentapeptide repeat-containing protein [Bryobacteraceae bacterium]|nr:pentapeptide repeat-containing protein [Bryobacteraceae bacterium]